MRTNVQQTSLLAYYDLQGAKLNNMQQRVYDLLARGGVFTNSEISHALHMPINCVTPRVYELREKGLVIPGAKRQCGITGRIAMTWGVR